jgi:sugar/nucleoside kinase (ribokinase family)
MNYWISNSREELLEAIAKIDVLIINDAEAREITDERNINKAMEKILNFGIKLVVVKKGEYGVAGLNSKGFFALPAFPLKEVVDPTGAGDTFAGGFMGYLAYEEKETDDNISIRNALAHGVALASFCVEDFSLNRLKKVTKEEILNRVNYLRKMVSF